MQPSDFAAPSARPSSPPAYIHIRGTSPEDEYRGYDGQLLSLVDRINIVTNTGLETEIVNLHEQYLLLEVNGSMILKKRLTDGMFDSARDYWRKRSRNQYQRAIAQWMQREMDLPGEVATMILEFV
jgi:hypothetical protein